ncbi:class I SAM-dependent methyltransferase [Curtobacterium flaccumfaciens pv. beticola]|uniref:class I SAM-dependent methyltransferase n=1 Tax=Curtobacterium flaccumfaciens TaxID=2035 RepID=UPI00349F4C44|nr:class I SAM-dependent methyltransferase [Curtobacterium flaccumfaciens pv. basellae]
MDEHDARDWWEARYARSEGIWSGRVNAVLAAVAADLPKGRALDLGCGEGGDVVWLAEQGWTATGVDLSATAVARAGRAAAAAGVDGRTTFVAADLATWAPEDDERYDLVTASFLQSWPVEIPRAAILRRAAGFVAPGGHLLVTAHAAPPHGDLPEEMRAYRFPTPEEDLAAVLGSDEATAGGPAAGDPAAGGPAAWAVLSAERRPRTTTTADGTTHETEDSVVLVRRRA